MSTPIPLRTDYDAPALRALARKTKDAPQVRRLLALAGIYDGASRKEAARIGNVTVQIVRDWVVRFNAEGPAGLLNRKAPGARPLLSREQWACITRIVEQGPNLATDGVQRWRLKDLVLRIYKEFGVSISEPTVSENLRALGYRRLSVRPRHHTADLEKQTVFKKTSERA